MASRKKELLDLYKKFGFVYGSCILKYEKNKNNEYKKKPYYKKMWEKEETSFFNENHNGFYIVTGKKSNLSVIDIDTLDNPIAKELKEKCDKCCNMIAQTKKGYHYYFLYDNKLKSSTCSKLGIDCRSDNGNIFCEPCWYNDEKNNRVEYKFLKLPVNKLKKIPENVLNFYLNSINKENKIDLNSINKENKIDLNKENKIDLNEKNVIQKTTLSKNNINILYDNLDNISNISNNDIFNLDIKSNKSDFNYVELINNYIFKEDENILRDLIDYYKIDISKKLDENSFTTYEKELVSNKIFLINIIRVILKKIIFNLNVNRNNDYNSWLHLGMILVKFGNYGIELWKEFSKRSTTNKINPLYDESEINKKITTFNNLNGLTFFSLLYWLKKDNNNVYNEILSNNNKLLNYLHSIKNKEYIYIEKTLSKSKSDISKLLSKILKNDLICNSDDIYHWDNNTNIWVKKTPKRLSYVILNILNILIKEEINRVKLLIENELNFNQLEFYKKKQKYLMKYQKICGDDKYCETLINVIYEELRREVDIIFDRETHVINFKNGLYDLKNNYFRNRVRSDYITKYLDYDYSDVKNENIIAEIKQKMLNISNDDPILLEFNLNWFAYCLTGETKEHACNFIIGYSASNGKSSLAKMFHYSFPIYATELDRTAFLKNNTKSHKFLCDLEIPVRFAYCEELEQENLDVNKIKHIVTAKSFKNEVLFSTNKDIITQAKLTFISNFDPKFSSDEGIKRRGLMQILTNKFLPKSEYDEINENNRKGIYIRDELFDKKFSSIEYKLSFFHILVPYANKYLNTQSFYVPKICKITFKNLCAENDTFTDFIHDNYEITGNRKDLVHKDDFLEKYNILKNEKLKWNDIISKVKNIVPYERDKRLGNKRGCLIGLKFIDNENFFED